MRKPCISLVFSLVVFGINGPALAGFGQCTKPTSPKIPDTFSDLAELQQSSDEVHAYLQAKQAYTTCLSVYGAENKKSLSAGEMKALTDEYWESLSQLEKTALRWNAVYTEHVETNTD